MKKLIVFIKVNKVEVSLYVVAAGLLFAIVYEFAGAAPG